MNFSNRPPQIVQKGARVRIVSWFRTLITRLYIPVLLLGCAILVTGLVLIGTEHDPLLLYRILSLTSLGLAIASLSLAAIFDLRRRPVLEFDNDQGVLRVTELSATGHPQSMTIPSTGFEGFQIARRDDGTVDVDLLRNDGAAWTLYRSKDFAQANKLCSRLAKLVKLGFSKMPNTSVILSQPIERSQDDGGTLLQWRPRSNLLTDVLHGIFLVSFAVGLFALVPGFSIPAAWAAVTYIVTLLLLIGGIGVIALRTMLLRRRRHQIFLSRDALTVQLQHGFFHRPTCFSRPLSVIGGVQLDGPFQTNGIAITLIPPRDSTRIVDATDPSPQIDTPDLGLCERVQLEYLLRNSLKQLRQQETPLPVRPPQHTLSTLIH